MSSNRPGPSSKLNRAIRTDWEHGADAIAQTHSCLTGKTHGIPRRRTLSAEKWRPVIVEIAEARGRVNGFHVDFMQACDREQISEVCRITDGETHSFVENRCVGSSSTAASQKYRISSIRSR